MSEQLWTSFNNQKFAAERAKEDWNVRELSSIVSNVKSDWNAATGSNGEILNKPVQLTLSGDGTYVTVTESSGTLTIGLNAHTQNYTVTVLS